MKDETAATTRWWGDFEVPHGSAGCWHIGLMDLWIQRLRGEWRVATSRQKQPREAVRAGDRESSAPPVELSGVYDARDYRVAIALPIPAEDAEDLMAMETVQRFGISGDSERIRLTPLLADRDVVSSPQKPFYIPAGERITVYIGSPLWLRIEAVRGGTGGQGQVSTVLAEMPIVRPSDTWFGASPGQGELCYASATFCRLRLEEVPFRPNRAVTTVQVSNRSADPFLLERMKIPVIFLPLFCDRDGVFWTRDLVFDYRASHEQVLRYGAKVPARAEEPELITPAREEASGNLAVRVFASLFAGT